MEVKSRRNNKPLKPARTRVAGLPAKVTRVKKIKSRVSQHIKSETVLCHMPSIRPAASPRPRNIARLAFRAALAAFASCLFLVILCSFLELVLEGAGQLVEESHLLAVLQEPSRGRGLICSGGKHGAAVRERPENPLEPPSPSPGTPKMHGLCFAEAWLLSCEGVWRVCKASDNSGRGKEFLLDFVSLLNGAGK